MYMYAKRNYALLQYYLRSSEVKYATSIIIEFDRNTIERDEVEVEQWHGREVETVKLS